MRVGVHLQSLRPGEIGGLEDYVRNLLANLTEVDPEIELVLFCADYNVASFDGYQTRLLSAAEFAGLDAGRLAAEGLDLWFCPLLVLEPAEPGLPAVATIPDLQHETYPELFTPEILKWRRHHYRHTVERAERVLTLSDFSRTQIVELLGAGPSRVRVTHLDSTLPAEAASPEAVAERYGLPERFFYTPGAAWPHKNHAVLFEALAKLRDRHDLKAPLVLTGAQVEGAVDLDAECRRLGIEDIVQQLGYVPREDLPALYAGSWATVLPSLFEGFGIPVVEAMRAGSPAICSSATSLPEVGGEAAVYFDSHDPDELCERLRDYWTMTDGERESIVRAGHRQAEMFSWRRTAEQTLEAFEEAVNDRPAVTSPSAAVAAAAVPLITVVTPSLNQASYIERTIDSVLGQGVPRLRHLVIDGGSNDGTVEILRRARQQYPERFDFVSESDRGQAHAVNKGFDRARGEIVGWLNSDDTYESGTFEAVAAAFSAHPEWDVLYGRGHYVGEDDRLLGVYPTRPEFDWQTLAHECFICQPTVFFRRRVLDELGFRLDDSLQMCMDYDFWIRLGKDLNIGFLDRVLASSRMYQDNKTISRRSEVYREIFRTVKLHYGRLPLSWALGRAHHVWDRGDPFFNLRRLTWVTWLIAGGLLLRHNWSSVRYWPGLCREVWNPVSAKIGKSWRLLKARDSTT
ncbi:MAG: glycosyltransferase [bacterium]|nr:glycosyltransferase [bacterium]